MDHVAIMTKSWDLIPKIISGQKTVESRWYQTRRAPWDVVKKGDTIYFKNAGEKATASARVLKVIQFALKDIHDTESVIARYGKKICLVNSKPKTWGKVPKYCILIFLKDARYLKKPFQINKTGFGAAAAWLSVKNVATIRV